MTFSPISRILKKTLFFSPQQEVYMYIVFIVLFFVLISVLYYFIRIFFEQNSWEDLVKKSSVIYSLDSLDILVTERGIFKICHWEEYPFTLRLESFEKQEKVIEIVSVQEIKDILYFVVLLKDEKHNDLYRIYREGFAFSEVTFKTLLSH